MPGAAACQRRAAPCSGPGTRGPPRWKTRDPGTRAEGASRCWAGAGVAVACSLTAPGMEVSPPPEVTCSRVSPSLQPVLGSEVQFKSSLLQFKPLPSCPTPRGCPDQSITFLLALTRYLETDRLLAPLPALPFPTRAGLCSRPGLLTSFLAASCHCSFGFLLFLSPSSSVAVALLASSFSAQDAALPSPSGLPSSQPCSSHAGASRGRRNTDPR